MSSPGRERGPMEKETLYPGTGNCDPRRSSVRRSMEGDFFFGKEKGKEKEKETRSRLLPEKSKEEEVMEEEEEEEEKIRKSGEQVIEGYLDREALVARITELETQLHNYECNATSLEIDKDLVYGYDGLRLLEAEENLKQEWNKLAEDEAKLSILRKDFDKRVFYFKKALELNHLNHRYLKDTLADLIEIKNCFFRAITNTKCDYCFVDMKRLVDAYRCELENAIHDVSMALEALYEKICMVESREAERERVRAERRG